MANSPDYQTAYDVLRHAVDEAARILDRARLQTTMKIQMETGEWIPEEEEEGPT